MTTQPDTVLKAYRLMVLRLAHRWAPYPALVTDFAQEGWVAAWHALSTYRPNERYSVSTHLMRHASWRMQELARGRPYTGQDRGKGSSQHEKLAPMAHEEIVSTFDRGNHLVEGIELAYHHGEIAEAVSRLTAKQQEFVYRRFWKDQDYPTISREMKTQSAAQLWRQAKDKLKEDLKHLEGVV